MAELVVFISTIAICLYYIIISALVSDRSVSLTVSFSNFTVGFCMLLLAALSNKRVVDVKLPTLLLYCIYLLLRTWRGRCKVGAS